MLSESRVVAFLATSMTEVSRRFYVDVLGLTLVEDSPFAVVLVSCNALVRIQKTASASAAPYTALGWEVEDLLATVIGLTESGVRFERHDGLQQDERGIWTAPGGATVAWFKDPDGNLLSLTQHEK